MSTNFRPARCSACRLARSPATVDIRVCTECGAPIRSNTTAVRCDVCRQPSRYGPSRTQPPPEMRCCWQCGNTFPAISSVRRCFTCRSTTGNVVQPAIDFSQVTAASFNPLANSFQPLSPRKRKITHRAEQYPRRPPSNRTLSATLTLRTSQRSPDDGQVQSILHSSIDFLQREYESRVQSSNQFPPVISPADIRASVARYENHMSASSHEGICSSCGRLMPSEDMYQLLPTDPFLQPMSGHLDNCGWVNGSWAFCCQCHSALIRQSIPKFAATNHMNVSLCQHYPVALDGLTLTEECLIAKSHPIGVVLKLRPGHRSTPTSYHALRGHFIIIPQDPGPLLQILPSPGLQFTELIKVLWLGSRPPMATDLKPFLVVRKHKVLAALQYLIQHNVLYQDVTIDHSVINNWPDDFIPSDLQEQVMLGEADFGERAGYTVDLQEHNYENDWQAAEDSPDISTREFPLVTGSVTTDINGERQSPDFRLLNAMHALVNDQPLNPGPQTESPRRVPTLGPSPASYHDPVINYSIRGQAGLLDQWQDPQYFTSAFPTLFPTGIGGHLAQRSIPVSLAAFADWALRHHSRRSERLFFK